LKANDILKLKFMIKKLNKWHPTTNKTNHYNVATSMGTYFGLYHHISQRATTQVKSTSLLHPKS